MANNDIDVGFLIKDAFKSIRRDFDYIYLFLLPLIIYIIAMVHVFFLIGDIFSIGQNPQDSFQMFGLIQSNLFMLIVMAIIYGIVFLITYSVAIAGVIKKFESQEKNSQMYLSEAFSFGLNKLPRIFCATLLAYLIALGPLFGLLLLTYFGIVTNSLGLIGLSVLLLLIVSIISIYVYCRVLLYMQTCVIEDLSVVECIKRSWTMTKGNALLIFITALILGVIGIAVAAPFMIVGNVGGILRIDGDG